MNPLRHLSCGFSSRPARLFVMAALGAAVCMSAPLAGHARVTSGARVRHLAASIPTLTVATQDDALGKAQDRAYFQPFGRKEGLRVIRRVWDGQVATLQAHAATEARPATWALVFGEDSAIRAACMQGSLVRLAGSADNPDGCGVPSMQPAIVLAWDRGWRPSPPRWADFWNVVRYPGKRGLRRDPRSTLEIALMADGVPPQEVYGVLSTPDGVDRAFRKLTQLRPYITWWSTPEESARIIENGGVLMGSVFSNEIATLPSRRHDIGVQWGQSLGDRLSWALVHGTAPAMAGHARDLLHYVVQPAQVNRFAALYPSGQVTGQAAGQAPAGSATASAGREAAVELPMNLEFWGAHLPDLSQRFADWLRGPA
ncbi:extracellular solute-binding protein [Novacetimonas pomaceti]|nr:extracellular solute-binding protein [Novacetimonas pomaceti]